MLSPAAHTQSKFPSLPIHTITDLASNPQVHVDMGATYIGILYHRGQIMRDIRNGVPTVDRNVQSVIATFASAIDKELSFHKGYIQTRGRLAYGVCERVERLLSKSPTADNPLLTAYTLACMEFADPTLLGSSANASPTYHQRRFAEMWMQNPQAFAALSSNQNKNVNSILAQTLQKARSSSQWQHVDQVTKDTIDFLYPGGTAAIEASANKSLRARGGRGKGKQEAALPPTSPYGCGFVQQPSFTYDDTPFKDHLKDNDNDLLRALLEPMPGLHTGAEVHISDGGLDDLEELSAVLPDVKGAKVDFAFENIDKFEASPDESCKLIVEAVNLSKDIKDRDEKREPWLAAGGGSDGMDVDDEEMDLSALRGDDEGDEMEE